MTGRHPHFDFEAVSLEVTDTAKRLLPGLDNSTWRDNDIAVQRHCIKQGRIVLESSGGDKGTMGIDQVTEVFVLRCSTPWHEKRP